MSSLKLLTLLVCLLMLVGCGGRGKNKDDSKSSTNEKPAKTTNDDTQRPSTDTRSERPATAEELLQRVQEFYAQRQQFKVDVVCEHVPPSVTELPTETCKLQVQFQRPFSLYLDAEEVGEPSHSFRLFNSPKRRTVVIDALNQYQQSEPYRNWDDLLDDRELRISVGVPDLILWQLLKSDANLQDARLALGKRFQQQGQWFDSLTILRDTQQYLLVVSAEKDEPYIYQAKKIVPNAAFPLSRASKNAGQAASNDVTTEFYRNWQSSTARPNTTEESNPAVSANLPSETPVQASSEVAANTSMDFETEDFEFEPTRDDFKVDSFSIQRDVWAGRHHRVVGRVVPDWRITLAGQRFTLHQYLQGKHLICYLGNPEIEGTAEDLKLLYKIYLDYFGQEFNLIALFLRAKPEPLQEVLNEAKVEINAGIANVQQRDKLFPTAAGPVFLLVDRQGIIRQLHVGRRADLEEQLRAEINSLLRRERYAAELLNSVKSPQVSGSTLVAALGNDSSTIRYLASQKLRKMKEDAIEPLQEGLQHYDQFVRAGSAHMLGMLGERAEPAVLDLIGRLGESSFLVRREATWALSRIGTQALPALTEALSDTNYRVRSDAARTIGMMGGDARTAIPILIRSLDDPNELVRDSVVQALAVMQDESMPALGAALQEKDELVHSGARQALQMMGPRAIDTLIKALRSDLPYVRTQVAMAADSLPDYYANRIREALDSQQQIRALDSKNAAELVEAFSNPKESVSRAAADAVAEKAKQDSKVFELLRKEASSPSAKVRLMVAHSLRESGAAAYAARDALVKLAGDSNPEVREQASEALGSFGEKVVPELRAAWKNDLPEEQQLGLLNAFAALGPASQPALDTVYQTLLNSKSEAVQTAAANALARIGPSGIEKLLGILASENEALYSVAGDALSLGGKAAVEPLIAATEHKAWVVRQWAAIALGRIGSPEAIPALAALQQLVETDSNSDVRIYAEEALDAIARSTN